MPMGLTGRKPALTAMKRGLDFEIYRSGSDDFQTVIR